MNKLKGEEEITEIQIVDIVFVWLQTFNCTVGFGLGLGLGLACIWPWCWLSGLRLGLNTAGLANIPDGDAAYCLHLGFVSCVVITIRVDMTGVQAVGYRRRRTAGYCPATQDSDKVSH